jgi:spermidine/putrescine transport system substrate-binding protein
MKTPFLRLPLLLAGLLLAGCGRESVPVLKVYNWAEYISEDLIARFEEEYNCKVVIDIFDSNEAMYAKLQAGGVGYDIAVPSSYQVNKMRSEGMLLTLDHTKLPNLAHLDPMAKAFTQDPDFEVSVPYLFTTSGLGVRTDRATDVPASWTVFESDTYAGRMTLLNDMRETLGAALKALGYSLNTVNPDEIAEARDLLIRWKANTAKFESEQFRNGLVSAEFLVVHGYSSDILQAMDEEESIAYLIPVEGVSLALDELVILKDAPNPDLAHAFINFMHDPAVAAENMEWVAALSPNKPAYDLVSEEMRNNPAIFLPEETLARCETIFDLGENEKLYIEAWDAVKSAP